jgi:Ca2+-binding RTX toxin-like protein
MATVTFYTQADMRGFLGYTEADSILSASSTEIRVGIAGDYYDRYLGSGFTFSGETVTGGTVTQFESYEGPGTELNYRISSANASAVTVYNYLIADQSDALKAYVLRGADSLVGSSSSDWLMGMAGNDTINGGAGNDTMDGGAGSDLYYLQQAGDRVVESTAGSAGGTDTVYSYLSSHTLATNVEYGAVRIAGTASLTGNALANRLTGGAGANALDGGTGVDTMIGGDGSDTYYVRQVGDLVSETNATAGSGGTDTVRSYLGSYTLTTNVERGVVALTSTASLTGNTLANLLTGGTGANALNGGAGNDTLIGGAGNDILTGSTGNDVFRFTAAPNAATNVDRIADFLAINDTIQLENAVFAKLTSTGTLFAANFRAGAGVRALDSNDYVLYDTGTGKLFYDADGSGTGAAVQIALLTGAPAITSADIFIT